jgi:hypothetical protein
MPANRAASFSRRRFVRSATLTAAATTALPRFAFGAPPDRPIKIGVVGCGGRGTGAAETTTRE